MTYKKRLTPHFIGDINTHGPLLMLGAQLCFELTGIVS